MDGMEFEIQRGYSFSFTLPALAGGSVLFVGDGGTRTVEVDDAGAFSLSAADTSAMPAGDWRWEGSIEDSTATCLVASGRAVVKRTLRADGESAVERTRNEVLLESAEAALAELAKGADTSVSVDGTDYSWETRSDLLDFVVRLRDLVRRERAAMDAGYRSTGQLKFTPKRTRRTW